MAIFSHLIPAERRHDMRDTSRRSDNHGRDHRRHRRDFDGHGDRGHRDHRW